MPSSSAWGAMGAFLESAGKSTQKIASDYYENAERDADRKKKEKKEFAQEVRDARARGSKVTGGKKIASAMEAIMNPVGVEEAEATLANANPKDVQKAQEVIREAGAAAAPALPRRFEANKVKNAMRRAIADQESTSTDVKEHPRAANGLQAFGKYGIVPELHIDKVGLNPKNPADVAKWKSDSALQEATFDRIIDENYKAAGGNVDKALELYYGKAKDKNAKQRLADGREMPSVNQYVEQVKSRMGGMTGAGVEKTAGAARQAIDELVSTDFKAPSKAKYQGQEKALGKLYAQMTPEEIEQNKEYLDRITGLAGTGREEYKDEMAAYGNNLNRQTTAAINAMKLDEHQQTAMAKLKAGIKSLSAEEVRALESRRKLLSSMRDQITDFTTRVGSAKPGARESILKTRPDMASKEEPAFWDRMWGRDGKLSIDDVKIQKKLDLIDRNIMETDRALAGLGGLGFDSPEEIEEDESTMLSGGGRRGGGIDPKYLVPVKRK